MSIHSHASCDQCERKCIPLGDDEDVNEDYLLESGWVCVKWGSIDEEDESFDETRDFCSFACASRWCHAQEEIVSPLREEADGR